MHSAQEYPGWQRAKSGLRFGSKKALNPNHAQEMPFRLKIPVKSDVNCISFTHHKGPLCLFQEMSLPIAIGIGLLTLITNFSCTIRVYVSLVSPRCFSWNVTMLTFHATQHTAVTKTIDVWCIRWCIACNATVPLPGRKARRNSVPTAAAWSTTASAMAFRCNGSASYTPTPSSANTTTAPCSAPAPSCGYWRRVGAWGSVWRSEAGWLEAKLRFRTLNTGLALCSYQQWPLL